MRKENVSQFITNQVTQLSAKLKSVTPSRLQQMLKLIIDDIATTFSLSDSMISLKRGKASARLIFKIIIVIAIIWTLAQIKEKAFPRQEKIDEDWEENNGVSPLLRQKKLNVFERVKNLIDTLIGTQNPS